MSTLPTELLAEAAQGSGPAAERLFVLVYDDLRRLAARYLSAERRDHTLQPTALVHEAYLRLVDQTRASYRDELHFKAVAAAMIRRVLIDHGRANAAQKRGGRGEGKAGRTRITLDAADARPADPGREIDLLDLDEALTALAALNPRQARIVDLRCFGGLEIAEVASVLCVSETLVKNEWRFARAWLMDRLRDRP